MRVTFDPAKDESNIAKHGISLRRAIDFDFANALYDEDNSQDYGETRYNAISWVDALLHALTFAQHGDDLIRAISLRRATRQEHKLYAEEF